MGQTMPEMATFLEEVYETDQGIRRQLMGATDSLTWEQAFEVYGAEMQRIDAYNLDTLQRIWNTYGWLIPEQVGGKGAHAQWLVIQHAPLEIQKEYEQTVLKVAAEGHMRKALAASFSDRVALREGRHQTYGSQVSKGPNGQAYVSPVAEPERLAELRSEMDMSTMEEYGREMGFTWNLENYMDSLPVYRVWEWGLQ